MQPIKRGIAICHYNRLNYLEEIVEAVKQTAPANTKIIICDDGSTERMGFKKDLEIELAPELDKTFSGEIDTYDLGITVSDIAQRQNVLLIQGPNKGVAANKNRALWALQDCHLICILEDDLKPIEKGWMEIYETVAALSGIHHFCRVQDKEIKETVPAFSAYMKENGLTPIYGPSPRGDLTFITSNVVNSIGAFNPLFRGAGYAHGEWSNRVARAGLINHPLKWIDIKEARDKIVQLGDTEGGRWGTDVTDQLRRNKKVLKELQRREYTYHELILE